MEPVGAILAGSVSTQDGPNERVCKSVSGRRCRAKLGDGELHVCRDCNRAAEQFEATSAQREEERKSRVREQCDLELLGMTGLSRDFFENRKGFSTFDAVTSAQKRGLRAARLCCEGSIGGVYLHGDTGTGKTHLAESAVADRVARGHRAIFRTARTLMLEIRSAFAPDATTSELTILRPYLDAPFLVIDDIGQGRITQFVADSLFTLIDHRNRLRLPTLVTSNYSPRDLALHLADGRECSELDAQRIVDRLMELCDEIVELTGDSYRVKAASRRRKS
jgi:DNA replication protein DnaC